MTEKRFDAVEHGNHIIYRENGQNMWRNKVHVRLNELYDENQELKERINELDEQCTKLCNFNLHNILDKKNKEIKQLKTLVDFYKDFQKDARELAKENDQLKKELDQLYLLIGRGDWSGLVDSIIKRS